MASIKVYSDFLDAIGMHYFSTLYHEEIGKTVHHKHSPVNKLYQVALQVKAFTSHLLAELLVFWQHASRRLPISVGALHSPEALESPTIKPSNHNKKSE